MASLEDKILGNDKLENYCSSSEDEAGYEDAEDRGGDSDSGGPQSAAAAAPGAMDPGKTYFTPTEKWSGQSANTGPKGVIKDWQRFKQLETERNEEKERERAALAKRLAITTRTTAAEDAAQREKDELEAEFAEYLRDDSLLREFQRSRMAEMVDRSGEHPVFGQVYALFDGDQFLSAVDKEDKQSTVVVHVFEAHEPACRTMNAILEQLADQYRLVKWCKIASSVAGLSRDFRVGGVPALLVYKAGSLIGNFVRVSDELGGEEFYASDVESFLIEHGMLPDKTLQPGAVAMGVGGAAGGGGRTLNGRGKGAAAAAESSDDD